MAVINFFPEPQLREQLLQRIAIRYIDHMVQLTRKRYHHNSVCVEHAKTLYDCYFKVLSENITSSVTLIEAHVKGMDIFQNKMDKIKEWVAPAMSNILKGYSLDEEEEPQIGNDYEKELVDRFAGKFFILEIKTALSLYSDRNLDKEARTLQRGISNLVLNSFQGEEKAFLEWFNSPIMEEIAKANTAFSQFTSQILQGENSHPHHLRPA